MVPTAWEREQKARYIAEREAETDEQNRLLDRRVTELANVLSAGLRQNIVIDHNARKLPLPVFDAEGLDCASREPSREDFIAALPSLLMKLVPGWKQRYAKQLLGLEEEFREAHREWLESEEARKQQLAERRKEHEEEVAKVGEQHLRMDELAADAKSGKQYAVEDYVRHGLISSWYPPELVSEFEIRYLRSRKELLVEYEFPIARDIVPAESQWRYVKARDAIEPKMRPAAETSKLYKSLLAQMTLRTIYEIFMLDSFGHIQVVAFNGFVRDHDPSTGRPIRPILISLRVDREEYLDREFSRVNPEKALQSLRANFSPAPTELQPVPPIVEFDVSDPRFIEEQEVVATLDQRTNLIDLTPDAFEQLITNLFNRMDFEAHATRRSKDGGIDCIAYYKKPVVSGKYVIQAKRWTNPVQVDAVRDLFGAMNHEHANKGILITTSKYAPACYRFAEDKPLQLIDGSGLLALIEEHTKLKVKIVIPPR